MPRRLVPTVLLALACLARARRAAPVAGALTRDAQTRQNVKLLKTYIDAYAGEHGFVYPAAAVVRKGGGLTAPVWPVNPWTGAAMAPGKARGTYTYTVSAKGDGYTLTGHLSSGSYTVTGGTPGWLADERARAAADLQGARTPPRQPRRIWPPRDRSATRRQPTRRLRGNSVTPPLRTRLLRGGNGMRRSPMPPPRERPATARWRNSRPHRVS